MSLKCRKTASAGFLITNMMFSSRPYMVLCISRLPRCLPQLWIQSTAFTKKKPRSHILRVFIERPARYFTLRSNKRARYSQPRCAATRDTEPIRSRNVTPTSWVQQEGGGKHSWHTNRKCLEPAHNGASCALPRHLALPPLFLPIARLLTYSPICPNPGSHPALPGGPPVPPRETAHPHSYAESSNENKKL